MAWEGAPRMHPLCHLTARLSYTGPSSDLCCISLMCVYAESLTQREEEQEAGRSEPEHGCPVSHGVTQCYPGCHTVLPASHCHTQCYVTEYKRGGQVRDSRSHPIISFFPPLSPVTAQEIGLSLSFSCDRLQLQIALSTVTSSEIHRCPSP